MAQNFRHRPITWESAETGVQGLHLALVQNYHLIFLGIKEVGVDGMRVVRGLQRAGVNTPVVLLMSRREMDQRREEVARLPNVIACLTKPLDMTQVEKAMDFLRNPPTLKAKDKVKLLEVLARIEKALNG
jgi:DNA-binding response OmpR family regulator